MSLLRVVCTECGATLASKKGFEVGQAVECPKCGTYFEAEPPPAARPAVVVEDDDEPRRPAAKRRPAVVEDDDEAGDRPRKRGRRDDDADDDDDRPVKKKKRRPTDDDDYEDRPRKTKKKSGGYATSPIRFVVLGILFVVMIVLAYLLKQKWDKEKNEAHAPHPTVVVVA